MAQYRIERGAPKRRSRGALVTLIALAFIVLLGARSLASFSVEYQWWKELGQVDTWFNMLAYGFAPMLAATLLAFGALWLAHARALKFAGTGLAEHPIYAWLSSFALLFVGYLIAAGSIDTWTIVRYLGARAVAPEANAWRDSVFGLPLKFYLFDLPFYSDLRGYLLALVIVCVLVYWIAARGWQLRHRLPEMRDMRQIDPSFFRLEGGLESRFLRGALVIFLLALALRFFLARYEMVYDDHGFMVGIDYVDQNFALPLQWLVIVCLPGRGRAGLDAPLDPGFFHGALAGRVVRRAPPGRGAIRPAQRNLDPAALHRYSHPRHALRLRPGPGAAHAKKSSSRFTPRLPSIPRSTKASSTMCVSGTGTPS